MSAVYIEHAAITTNLCEDAAVGSVEDLLLGIIPALCYVVAHGNPFSQDELRRRLRRLPPQNHIPRQLIAVDAMPRTGSGKVMRSALRKLSSHLAPQYLSDRLHFVFYALQRFCCVAVWPCEGVK